MRDEHPLSNLIKKLFEEERKRYDHLIQIIEELFNSIDIEPKSAWLSGKIAKGIDDYYPEIILWTINYLNKKVHEIDSGEKRELIEWRNILENMLLQRLKKFLESDSERANRLRQSLPFWPILTEKEREKLIKIKSRRRGR